QRADPLVSRRELRACPRGYRCRRHRRRAGRRRDRVGAAAVACVVSPGRPDGDGDGARAGRAAAMTGGLRRDDGSAVVEFVWLAVLLLVPLVYVVMAALSVQRAAFAETAAAREAARAYATAGSDAVGEERAEQAVA